MTRHITPVLWLLLVPASGASLVDDKEDAEKELKKFQGAWVFESQVMAGMKTDAEAIKDFTLVIDGDKFTLMSGKKVIDAGTFKLNPSKSPKEFDATGGAGKKDVLPGIYELNGDALKVCLDKAGKKRPTEFKSEEGSAVALNIYKRAKK